MTGWAAEMLVATTLLMAVVLLIRRPFARLFGARAAYALWLVPVLRLLLPPLPVSGPAAAAPSLAASADYLLVSIPSAPSAGGAPLLLFAWVGGAIAFVAIQYWRHWKFMATALAGACRIAAPGCHYPVLASSHVRGPVATGLLRPLILVPNDFERMFTPAQQRLALLHEELHHRRGDLWASAAALLVTSIHWFNPLAHLAARSFRRDMEAACDARLLAEVGHSEAADYADTLVRCTSRRVPRSLCSLTTVDELKRRLQMLKLNETPARRAAGLICAGLMAVAGVSTASAAQDKASVETREFVKKIEVRHVDGKHGAIADRQQLMMACPGEKFEVASEGGDEGKKEKFKFVLCTKAGESLLPALEKAEAEIAKRDEMPVERKAEILAKIRAKIAELRSRG